MGKCIPARRLILTVDSMGLAARRPIRRRVVAIAYCVTPTCTSRTASADA
jgi:hypothetical protein